jgi:hypothetical protein
MAHRSDRAAVRRATKPATRLARFIDARTCYGHLAGRLGMAVTDALLHRRCIVERGGALALTPAGERFMQRIGVDAIGMAGITHRCVDWSERRAHLAGRAGRALAGGFLRKGWVRRVPGERALTLTARGRAALAQVFGARLPD